MDSATKRGDTPLKLNYKRTFLIGFAFFGILLLWQVYDSWCPTFLTDIFARRIYGLSSAELKASAPDKILNVQWIVGIIMAYQGYAYWGLATQNIVFTLSVSVLNYYFSG